MTTELTQEEIRPFVMVSHGDLEAVKQMLADDPRLLNTMYEEWQETPLGAASHVGNRPIAEFLLAQGAPLTIYTAAMLGRTADVVQFLEDDASLINSGGAHNISLLFHAALSGDLALLKLLVERGNTQSADQPLLVAVGRGDGQMASWLLARGADVAVTDFKQRTPLAIAEANADATMIALLKEYGAV